MIVDGNLLRDHHGDIIATLPRDMNPNDLCEIKRRVNGHETLVAALKGMLSPPENGGEVLEKIKIARAALKEAGCE